MVTEGSDRLADGITRPGRRQGGAAPASRFAGQGRRASERRHRTPAEEPEDPKRDRHRHDAGRHLDPQPRLRLDADGRRSSASACSASPAPAPSFKGLGVSQNPDVDFPVVNVSVTLRGRVARDHGDGRRRPRSRTPSPPSRASSRSPPPRARARPTSPSSSSCQPQHRRRAAGRADARRPGRAPPAPRDRPADHHQDQPRGPAASCGCRSPATARPPSWPTTCATCMRPQFQTIEGVGEVLFGGYRERNLRVWFDAARLEAQGLTVARRDRRHRARAPRGARRPHRDAAARDERARGGRGASTSRRSASLVVAFRGRHAGAAAGRGGGGGRPRGPPPARARAGRALAGLRHPQAARRQRGRGRASACSAKVAQVQSRSCPRAWRSASTSTARPSSKHAIDEILFTLLLAALLTGLVCWVFLGSWSTTLNVLLAIPTSILGTFIVMYFFGFTLNTFTVLGPHAHRRHRGRRRDHGAREHLPAPRARRGQGAGGLGRRARDHLRGRRRHRSPSSRSSCRWPS